MSTPVSVVSRTTVSTIASPRVRVCVSDTEDPAYEVDIARDAASEAEAATCVYTKNAINRCATAGCDFSSSATTTHCDVAGARRVSEVETDPGYKCIDFNIHGDVPAFEGPLHPLRSPGQGAKDSAKGVDQGEMMAIAVPIKVSPSPGAAVTRLYANVYLFDDEATLGAPFGMPLARTPGIQNSAIVYAQFQRVHREVTDIEGNVSTGTSFDTLVTSTSSRFSGGRNEWGAVDAQGGVYLILGPQEMREVKITESPSFSFPDLLGSIGGIVDIAITVFTFIFVETTATHYSFRF